MLIKIIMICLITFELWYLQILYKNRYNQECKENEDFRDRAYKWSEKILKEYSELIEDYAKLKENYKKIMEENQKLIEQLKKCKKNRVSKVIKEEKTNESI